MQSETSRVEAFSDGVFAIAITLLILEIKVPHRNQGPLAAGLLNQWPSYLAYLLSFFFVGIMWINHHRMFTLIKKSDDVLMILNLLLLLGVSVVPFPTEVLAEHLGGPGQKIAALFYNSVWLVVAVIFNVLWRYVVKRHLLDRSISAEHAAGISRQYAFGPLFYAVCFALVWVDVRASLAANIILAIYFLLPPSLLRKQEHPVKSAL
jgi:uncharacterized membrane protein